MCVFLYCLHKSNLFNVLDESAVREIAIHHPMDIHRPRVGNSPTLVQSDRGLTTLVQSQRSVVQSGLLDSDFGAKPRITVQTAV